MSLKRIRNGLVEVVIEDEGPGIPGESLEYVQEPFKKLDPEGTGSGLGLAIVKAILAEAGASIEFENKKPNGLRVRVRLHE